MKIPQYDIYSGTFDEEAKWLEAVDGADYALKRMELFADKAPGPYFVFCHQTRRVVAIMNTVKTA